VNIIIIIYYYGNRWVDVAGRYGWQSVYLQLINIASHWFFIITFSDSDF